MYDLPSPAAAVEVAVADGFADVDGLDVGAGGEVGYGAGYFENAVVGAGRHVVFGHYTLEYGGAFVAKCAVLLHEAGSHLGIAVHRRL